MSDTIDLPELLKKRSPLGQLLIEFITSTEDKPAGLDGISAVYPGGKDTYNETVVEIKLNGVEVPVDALELIFFRYAEHFARKVMKEEFEKIVGPSRDLMYDLEHTIEKVHKKIERDFGLSLNEYE